MIRSKDSSGNVKSISATVTELQDAVASRDIPTNINDAWYAYLGDQGFTGSLDDRMFAFLASRTGIDVADVSDLYARWNGVVTGAVLYHDFANDLHVKENVDGTFDDFITFDRNSTVNGFVEGPVLTEFAIDQPAFVIDPATGQRLGYRALAGFTNSLLDNRDLSTGNWFNSGLASADATGLDGVANAAHTITDDNDSSAEFLRQSLTVSDNSAVHTISVFIKKDSDETRFPVIRQGYRDGTSQLNYDCSLNTAAGTATPFGDASASNVLVEDQGDWWRLSISGANNGTGNTTMILVVFPAADSSPGGFSNSTTGSIVYDFGGVYLNSSIAGPPIETEGSPVSTAADDATEPLPASCQDGFVWVVHARAPELTDSDQWLGQINDGTNDNRIGIRIGSGGGIDVLIRFGGTNTVLGNVGGSFSGGQDIKIAVVAQDGDYRASVNGSTVSSDTRSGFPAGLTDKIIGAFSSATGVWNSTIALDYLDPDPSAWSDAALQNATS